MRCGAGGWSEPPLTRTGEPELSNPAKAGRPWIGNVHLPVARQFEFTSTWSKLHIYALLTWYSSKKITTNTETGKMDRSPVHLGTRHIAHRPDSTSILPLSDFASYSTPHEPFASLEGSLPAAVRISIGAHISIAIAYTMWLSYHRPTASYKCVL